MEDGLALVTMVLGGLALVSVGNCWRDVHTMLQADVLRSGIAHDESEIARNDFEIQRGHLETTRSLVFCDELDCLPDRYSRLSRSSEMSSPVTFALLLSRSHAIECMLIAQV